MTSPSRATRQCVPAAEPDSWWCGVRWVVPFFSILVIFFLTVLLRVRPELFYQQNPVIFRLDRYFFTPFLDLPGGLVEYATAFLSPLFFRGWLGSLVVTVMTTIICLATRRFFQASTGVGGRVVFLFPAVLILVFLEQYIHPVKLCMGLVVALTCVDAYLLAGDRRVAMRIVAFFIGCGLIYYVAAGLVVVYGCMCGLFEMGSKRRWMLGTSYLLFAAAVPAAGGEWLFDMSVQDSYGFLLLQRLPHWLAMPSSVPLSLSILWGLLLFFPVAAVFVLWRERRVGSSGHQSEKGPGGEPVAETLEKTRAPGRTGLWGNWAVPLLVIAVLGVVADVVLFDSQKKSLLQMVSNAEQGRWADVLTHARRLSPADDSTTDARTVFEVNRALYHGGRLLDEMFTYPQGLHSPTLTLIFETPMVTAGMTPRQCSEILFDLGRINESEHMAFEALETYGERPELLKRLVYIQVLKGEPEAARRFLGLLESSLLHREWARECRRELDADPTLSTFPVVASRRELMVMQDSIDDVDNLEAMLLGLLKRNSQNRMAFEYLIAHYLLTEQLDKFVNNLQRFEELGYRRLPQHCEEALVIFLSVTGSKPSDVPGPPIQPITWLRFGRFARIYEQLPKDASKASVADALYSDFGGTYFYCHLLGHNLQIEQE